MLADAGSIPAASTSFYYINQLVMDIEAAHVSGLFFFDSRSV